MNKELKSLLFISTGLFLIFVLIFNLYTYNAARFIPQASKQAKFLTKIDFAPLTSTIPRKIGHTLRSITLLLNWSPSNKQKEF